MRVWRMRTGISIALTTSQRRRLKAIVRDRNAAQKHVWRARIVLLPADHEPISSPDGAQLQQSAGPGAEFPRRPRPDPFRPTRTEHDVPQTQLEANRRNALKSTGPKTEDGKQQSRRNAIRHGLTAETVIEPLEDPEESARLPPVYDASSLRPSAMATARQGQ